jgi:hypothetical protein
LERGDSVKAITLADIARACRIGTDKLRTVNEALADCGFITMNKPTGQARLMHWTTEIVVHDPPMQVSKELIDKYGPRDEKDSYGILTPWLMVDDATENLNPTSVEPIVPVGSSAEPKPKIESLDLLQPLNVKEDCAVAPTSFQGWVNLLREQPKKRGPTLMWMIETLFPEMDKPEFSYLGRVTKKLGAERMAQLLWQASTRPPVGDILAYVQGAAKGNGGGKSNGGSGRIVLQGGYVPKSYTAEEWDALPTGDG